MFASPCPSYVRVPVQLDGRGDLDDVLARMVQPIPLMHVEARLVDSAEAEVLGPEPKRRARRAMRAECWPFPDAR